MTVHPAKTQIRPVWSESSLSQWRKLGSLATHWAHSEDSDQTWADAQADLESSLGAQSFCWFCHGAAQIWTQCFLFLIRLGGCPYWSEYSLGAHAILLVFSWGGSYSNDGQFETEFYPRMKQAGRDRKISDSHRKRYSWPMCENGLSQMM